MDNSIGNSFYFLPELFLRAPQYSFISYDLSRLPEVLQHQGFQNAIWLASPDFFQVLARKDFDFFRLNDRERFTTSKYYNRICFRPTPFGSFASFTLLEWGNGDPVSLVPGSSAKLHLLPDQQVLTLSAQLRELDLKADQLILNPCLYLLDKTYRYPQSLLLDSSKYDFRLKALDAVKFHQGLIELFQPGQVGGDQILKWMMHHGECTAAEALDYLQFLLNEQFLLSPVQGHMIEGERKTGEESLQEPPGDIWEHHHLVTLKGSFTLPEIARRVSGFALLEPGKKAPSQPFYAALERTSQGGGPGPRTQEELTQAIRILRRLIVPHQPEDLTRFVREFKERYDREKVPLLLALDPDSGLTYGSLGTETSDPSVLENLRFSEQSNEVPPIGWGPVHRLLMRIWTGNQSRDPWSPIEIKDVDLPEQEAAKNKSVSFPQTQALIYRQTGEHLVIEHGGGVTATSIIGRFSCFSAEVHRFCRELAAREMAANPDVIFTDIGQLSDTHVDNINRRSVIYPYEIPVNVYSRLPGEQQIRPDDLLISVQGDQLILESRRLAKRVIPRLATAFNFRHNQLSVFRLLCDLQFQGLSVGLSLDLEQLFPGMYFYPRVMYRNTILFLAKWKLTGVQILPLIDLADAGLIAGLQIFRQTWHIPRYISLGTYDQQLNFDLADAAEARFFIQCLKGLKEITIMEYLFPDRSVRSGNKPVAGQFIAFLTHDGNIYKPLTNGGEKVMAEGPRNFLAGSDWLYLKIYCTPRTANAILSEVIRPFITSNRKSIDKWFFVRYHDKSNHLRLRIHAVDMELGPMLVALQKRITAGGYDKLIHDYQLDTYRQEIERYGAVLMPLVEAVFHAGSTLAIWFLRQIGQGRDWSQFQFGLVTANLMIRSFFPDHTSRLIFIREVTGAFFLEFGGNKILKVDMDLKYRQLNTSVETAIRNTIMARKVAPVLKNLKELKNLAGDQQPADLRRLAADLIHMQMNRTFESDQRKQEFLIYYCLEKYEIGIRKR